MNEMSNEEEYMAIWRMEECLDSWEVGFTTCGYIGTLKEGKKKDLDQRRTGNYFFRKH